MPRFKCPPARRNLASYPLIASAAGDQIRSSTPIGVPRLAHRCEPVRSYLAVGSRVRYAANPRPPLSRRSRAAPLSFRSLVPALPAATFAVRSLPRGRLSPPLPVSCGYGKSLRRTGAALEAATPQESHGKKRRAAAVRRTFAFSGAAPAPACLVALNRNRKRKRKEKKKANHRHESTRNEGRRRGS